MGRGGCSSQPQVPTVFIHIVNSTSSSPIKQASQAWLYIVMSPSDFFFFFTKRLKQLSCRSHSLDWKRCECQLTTRNQARSVSLPKWWGGCEFFSVPPPGLVAKTIKNLPAVRETQVSSLGREDPLEKGMATHSSILAWRIPWTGLPVWWQGRTHPSDSLPLELATRWCCCPADNLKMT